MLHTRLKLQCLKGILSFSPTNLPPSSALVFCLRIRSTLIHPVAQAWNWASPSIPLRLSPSPSTSRSRCPVPQMAMEATRCSPPSGLPPDRSSQASLSILGCLRSARGGDRIRGWSWVRLRAAEITVTASRGQCRARHFPGAGKALSESS